MPSHSTVFCLCAEWNMLNKLSLTFHFRDNLKISHPYYQQITASKNFEFCIFFVRRRVRINTKFITSFKLICSGQIFGYLFFMEFFPTLCFVMKAKPYEWCSFEMKYIYKWKKRNVTHTFLCFPSIHSLFFASKILFNAEFKILFSVFLEVFSLFFSFFFLYPTELVKSKILFRFGYGQIFLVLYRIHPSYWSFPNSM